MTSRWKLAGSVESGWKYFWTKYQSAPTMNMMSINGETSGSKNLEYDDVGQRDPTEHAFAGKDGAMFPNRLQNSE